MLAASNLSVVVITFNEEENLPRLLASLPAGVELIVLDSGSTDRTTELAKGYGARVETRPFDGYAAQKNAALKFATKPWTLSLDADERPTAELWQEILARVNSNDTTKAYRLPRRQVFLGKNLRFGKTSDAPLRLIASGQGKFSHEIHEQLIPKPGVSVHRLRSPMEHYSYKNLSDYFERFNRYTTSVAEKHVRSRSRRPSHVEQALRFFAEFFWRYILRAGFLDGYPGFIYALFGSVYVFVKYAKLEEQLILKNLKP